ncbi:MAG: hypothetical protein KBD76_16070 [Bacteriovorax sp.]|nr:hypothetical protein [Bacteriovorax sp.]
MALKVAITCDYLLERNHYSEIVELICELFPEARIYCFAHREGAILGHIEQRMITSTFLSKRVHSEKDFYLHSYKIPSLAKNLFVSCEYDLIINISKGFSQGISKCKSTKVITYLYELGYENKMNQTILQKMFRSYVESWSLKSLLKSDLVIVSREDLKTKLQKHLPDIEVTPPPFRLSDYSLFPKEMFKHHFFAIETSGLSLDQARMLVSWMREWDQHFQFIGHDEHLNALKKECELNQFFGNRCSGEHAPVLASSKALISFNDQEFPNLALATMATGRPVILGNSLKKWVSGTGTFFASFSKGSIKAMIDEVISNEDSLEGQKIRAHVMQYHDIKFKAQMKRVVERFTLN